ncbi:hypothetical protein B0H13DRAFT_1932789 [Mycena leptocephala]|nr:hypothetical protein B0H13DRAFT_1932789 [Mycena leptocephala]
MHLPRRRYRIIPTDRVTAIACVDTRALTYRGPIATAFCLPLASIAPDTARSHLDPAPPPADSASRTVEIITLHDNKVKTSAGLFVISARFSQVYPALPTLYKQDLPLCSRIRFVFANSARTVCVTPSGVSSLKISSAPAIRALASARARPPPLLWTERLVSPARCCIHEYAAGAGPASRAALLLSNAIDGKGITPSETSPFALYPIRTARCRHIIPLLDTSMATVSARGRTGDLRRTLIGAPQDARAPIVGRFHEARVWNIGAPSSLTHLHPAVHRIPPSPPPRLGFSRSPVPPLYYLPSFALLWRMGRSLRVRGTTNATSRTTLAHPALRRQGVRPTSGAALPLQRRRIYTRRHVLVLYPHPSAPSRSAAGLVSRRLHTRFARETRREVRAARGGGAPHRRCTTRPEHPLYWQIAFLGPGNGTRAFQRLVGVDEVSRSSEIGSL